VYVMSVYNNIVKYVSNVMKRKDIKILRARNINLRFNDCI